MFQQQDMTTLNDFQLLALQQICKCSTFVDRLNEYYEELKDEWGVGVAKHWNIESIYRAVTEPGYSFADEVGTLLDNVADSTLNDELIDMTNGHLNMMILSKAAYNNCSWA